MSNFLTSSQKNNWIFGSQDEINEIKKKRSKRAFLTIKKTTDKWNQLQNELKMQGNPHSFVRFESGKVDKTPILTAEEELKYLNCLIQTVIIICDHLKLRNDDVINTAIEYLKRFYLKQTFYDFDGLDMMYTAIFLAIKVEEVNYTLIDFARTNKQCKIEKVVQNEAFLIKGLKFQFFIYSPYRAYGALCDLFSKNADRLVPRNGDIISKDFEYLGKKIIRITHLNDLSFLYSSSIIAFAIFKYLYRNLLDQDVMYNEALVNIFKNENIFQKSFWEREEAESIEEIYVNKVYLYFVDLFGDYSTTKTLQERIEGIKTPDISSIKIYKKYIKVVHTRLPNYLKDKEKARKIKEVIPADFMSDDEIKEQEEVDGFKPPKPMKPGKRTLSGGKPKESSAPAPTQPPVPQHEPADAKMVPDEGGQGSEVIEDDMEISITLESK
ncbi:unnamed protein product [Moneuplotes crassus]|uniref:Cyclin N-terminal domain-containing protein n=1 Tax=Euplotes crassus TaxID=5936 RepID=A0AAD1XFG5_EUPCR|nr:unnamed protein product [Moneuplotes crassus]